MKRNKKEKLIKKRRETASEPQAGQPLTASDVSGTAASADVEIREKKKIRTLFALLAGAVLERSSWSAAGIMQGVLFGLLSFLFGRTPLLLDTYPLAIALLSSAEKNVIFILVGAIVSAFTVTSEGVIFSTAVYLSAYIMTVLIRVASRLFIDRPVGLIPRHIFSRKTNANKKTEQLRLMISSMFGENVYLRMATACVASFLVSLYAMNAGNYRFYDLFSAMFAMVAAPAVTFIFSNVNTDDGDSLGVFLRNLSRIALLSAAVLSVKDISVIGINISAFLAFGASVYLAMKKGILTGAFAGLLSGLAFSPIYAPAFVLSAIAGGVMSSSVPMAVTLSTGVAMLWGAYIDGFGSFTMLMPALLSASVLVCASDRLKALPTLFGERVNTASEIATASEPDKELPDIERLSVTFGELSKALYDISGRMSKPGASEIRSICLHGFEKSCKRCPKNDECHLGNYGEFSEMVTKVGEVLDKDKRVRTTGLPEYITKKCVKLNDILTEINTSFAELIKERITGEKTELLALDYDGISHILADAAEVSRKENEIDIALTERMRIACSDPSIGMKEITVRGGRKKRIYSGDIGKKAEKMGSREIKELLEEAYGAPLCDPVFELKNGKVALRTEEAERFSAESGVAVISGKGESVSGDSAEVFKSGKDNFYALISDGMGSGQSAAYSSEICTLFLREMLCGGNKKETSLKMLNTLLRSKGEECSATVDLMEINLIEGRASFIKSGAAPSFVRRGDKLYKLRSNTAPIGILQAIDAEQVHFDVEDGDVMIMLSDGISQSPEECFWLMELIGGEWNENESLDSVADRIAKTAVENGSTDDASVVLVRVKRVA